MNYSIIPVESAYKTEMFLHYENTPIQIYRTFHLKQNENFQIKPQILLIFLLET